MAILMKKATLISDHQANLLASLAGRVDIYFAPTVPGAFPSEVVFLNKMTNVSLTLDYEDLEFKFEYFFFKIRPFFDEPGEKIQSAVIKSIHCLFRCEWKSNSEGQKLLFKRGKLEDVPDNSIACCSDIGFLMLSTNGSRVLIYSDDDFPLSIGVTEEDDFIDSYLKSCDVVDIEDLSKFSRNVVAKGFDVDEI